MAVAVALGSLSLVVVGLLPAWKIAQQHLIDAIKDGGQNVSRTLDRTLMRRVMVASQVAGSCLLLIVAGMMIRSVQRAIESSAGFDYERAAVLSMPLGRYGITGDAARLVLVFRSRNACSPIRKSRRRPSSRPRRWAAASLQTNYDATPGLRHA